MMMRGAHWCVPLSFVVESPVSSNDNLGETFCLANTYRVVVKGDSNERQNTGSIFSG